MASRKTTSHVGRFQSDHHPEPSYSRFLSLLTYDFHIIRRFLTGYLLLIAGLIVFFIVLHYVEYVDDFIDRGATMRQVFLVYYPNSVPEIVKLVSPLAAFLSAVILTGRLSQKLELASLQTSGVSLYRILAPYVTTGVTITVLMFWFNGWVVPETNRIKIDFEQKYTKDAAAGTEISNIHRQNSPGSIISVSYYDRNSITANLVTLETFDTESRLKQRIDARAMRWLDSTRTWRFLDATIREFEESGLEHRREIAQLDTILVVLPRDLARTQADVEAMTIPDAADYLDTLRRTGANRLGQPLVLYYTKYAYPFANLILILIAVPLAAVRRRGGQTVQIGIGLFVAFVYLAVMKLSEPFGYAETIPPMVAAWLPHLLFLAIALILLYRVRK